MDQRKKLFQEYTERMAEIRILSTPSLDGITDADGYSRRLSENFIRIGELANENRAFMDSVFDPLMSENHLLMEDEAEDMMSFGERLVSAELAENLDLPLAHLLAGKLVKDAEKKESLTQLIRRLDARTSTLYELLNMTIRLVDYPEIAARYREKGFAIGEFFFKLLEKDSFLQLDEESREIALTNARYSSVFYEGLLGDAEANAAHLDLLDRILDYADDKFYLNAVPDMDWNYYVFRALQYYTMVTEFCNHAGYNGDELRRILARAEQLLRFWDDNREYFETRFHGTENRTFIEFHLERNRYLVGEIDAEEYKKRLRLLYAQRKAESYHSVDIFINLSVPLEYIYVLHGQDLTEEDYNTLMDIYRNILSYAFHMPNSGTMFGLLEYYMGIIDRFIEVPGRISFEDMMLQCLAAFHPPTYVHSVMVAQLSRCLTEHLILRYPGMLIGMFGCHTTEDVLTHRTEIVDYAYHAALCHDFGKLSIIDTIFVYGRRLFDMEFDLIRTHPRTGAEMLCRYESTRSYAPIARGHHRFYDGSGGYPMEFDNTKSPVRVLIDLVHCADCMDAATDRVGRSYNRGKTLDEFIGELKEGSGTRYAPWLVDLLTQPDVYKDVRRLLKKERPQNYRNTYYLLKDMQNI